MGVCCLQVGLQDQGVTVKHDLKGSLLLLKACIATFEFLGALGSAAQEGRMPARSLGGGDEGFESYFDEFEGLEIREGALVVAVEVQHFLPNLALPLLSQTIHTFLWDFFRCRICSWNPSLFFSIEYLKSAALNTQQTIHHINE